MRNYSDEDDEHDYSPNELAHLSIRHKDKYEQIVQSNLEYGDTIEDWERRNIEQVQKHLNKYR